MKLFRSRATRQTEATTAQVAATGAAGWAGSDDVDPHTGFRRIGGGPGGRPVPYWTHERARTWSIAGYRANPMVKAIIDTYTSFCVGDSGLTVQCGHAETRAVVEAFYADRRNRQPGSDIWLRDHLLMGETLIEPLVGAMSGRVRLSVIDPTRISGVTLDRGNPLWPATVVLDAAGDGLGELAIIDIDDLTGRRTGDVEFWASWQALLTDTRGYPFLGPILDWLDAYDQVVWNLIDRTALARHLVFDVTVEGGQQELDEYLRLRGHNGAPRSGTVEFHNDKVKWEPKAVDVGSFEDTNTAKTILTSVAGGAGLAKTWLADAEDANRATSITMAEPVRRRVGGVQNVWLGYQTEFSRYVVDKAVEAGRLPAEVLAPGAGDAKVNPAELVTITGPEIAAADAQVTAQVLVELAQGVSEMRAANLLSQSAAEVLVRKAWEDYAGIPYQAELDQADGSRAADVATQIDSTPTPAPPQGAATTP